MLANERESRRRGFVKRFIVDISDDRGPAMSAAADYINQHYGYVQPGRIESVFRGAVQAHVPTCELRQRLRLNHRTPASTDGA